MDCHVTLPLQADAGTTLRGEALLHDPTLNKGTAFTHEERERLGLRGLLPPQVQTIEQQQARVLENVRRKTNSLEKYIYMIGLQDRNETLFYHVVMNNLEEMIPILYTPTVGKACQTFGHIFRRTRGMYISLEDSGHVAQMLDNWNGDVRVIVMTDGERILGLGDLGANGMGIPNGKLSLYTACAGIDPAFCLPITIDVGTNNAQLRDDPLYLGLHRERERGPEYDALIEEVFAAVEAKYPGALVQFEDFGTENAFRLLEAYRDRACTFNDDIQGTAAVTLAGIFSATRITGVPFREQKILFSGAGEAGIGIGELFVSALVAEGLTEEEARLRCWFVDSRGLVVSSRDDLDAHKLAFAHDAPQQISLRGSIEQVQPTALIGVSGQTGIFTGRVIQMMSEINDRPIIFPLSNPTANSECTARDAYIWSSGRAVFASGSPFAPVDFEGYHLVPGQANNAYIFPGVGLGVMFSGAAHVTDEMFDVAARTLAGLVGDDDLRLGRVFPALSNIRGISLKIAAAVARVAYNSGLATHPEPVDLEGAIAATMYKPRYRDF
ncbi:MAG: NAD-dependent malic enzyme [Chloroflexota bacterium]